jgi:hypothetical protein
MDFLETSTNNYQSTLRNIYEERRYLNRGGSFGLQLYLIKEKIPSLRA